MRQATIHHSRGDWADLVVDHRVDLFTPWFPPRLPRPGLRSAIDRWHKGKVSFDLPDTSHLPSGGPGGRFTIVAHVVDRGPSPADRTLVAVMTYPDGFRLATMWPGESGDLTETWRAWMSGPDGMSVAFTSVATPWVIAQRAWGTREWYEFLDAQPSGVSLKPGLVEAMTKAGSFGATGSGSRLARVTKHDTLTQLQVAGFWLLDRAQARWLSSTDAPLASAVDADTKADDSARLWAMYQSGWKVEVYENWLRDQPSNQSKHHARNFLRHAATWEDTVVEAYAVMAQRAASTGRPAHRVPVNDDGVEQIGEVASLCMQLALRPITIGVMVADGTFEITALRTLAALRATPFRKP